MPTEENKAVIRRLEEALNTGRTDAGLDLFADPCLFNGQSISPQVIPQIRAPAWAAIPDIRWTLEQMIAEGEWVAVRWSVRGTHTGDFAHPTLGSAPASGNSIAVSFMDHYRIAGGQIAEGWEVGDRLTLLQQLGVIPTLGQARA